MKKHNQRSKEIKFKGFIDLIMFFRNVFQQGLKRGVRYQSTAAKAQEAASGFIGKITGMLYFFPEFFFFQY